MNRKNIYFDLRFYLGTELEKKLTEINEIMSTMNTSSTEYLILREGFKVDEIFWRSLFHFFTSSENRIYLKIFVI